MKKFLYILTASTVLLTSSCELVNVLEVEPPNNLVPENVVKDAQSAEDLLNGAYSVFNDQYYYMFTETVPGLLSGSMSRNGFLANSELANNAVTIENNDVANFWKVFYRQIDAANAVIELVPGVPSEQFAPNRKSEILAEAHFLRAMSHFELLRYFGKFYDRSSPLGVILRTEPANFTTRDKGRATVQDTYDLILKDLDMAIANGPAFSKTYYASKTAAKALKARVLLFMGEYAAAAALADEVITESGRKLEATYAGVFDKNINSTEMILMRYTDDVTVTSDRKKFTYGSRHAIASNWLASFMTGDPRAPITFAASNKAILKVNNTTNFSPTYFIRLAEMYLIKAEGLARSGAPLEEAKAPLETVRSRALGLPYISLALTREQLLDEIYREYVQELAFENGSEWFAGIRFDKIMTVKPSVTSPDQFILPIPLSEIQANADLGIADQNPGYNQ
ncbi:RagB/SusD family nutrient uptake outer membrane protein [Botryobacter ruber]|uniref:RagB/SusD family nutrient uptake outer membrane protein n=1 Tax=Botryobacter ruber TaxID=2171629 RepID=UPI000E0C890A|nr:RagB/SusD family nutrient uptake outer membrane protein [Botryobacter ruber]